MPYYPYRYYISVNLVLKSPLKVLNLIDWLQEKDMWTNDSSVPLRVPV